MCSEILNLIKFFEIICFDNTHFCDKGGWETDEFLQMSTVSNINKPFYKTSRFLSQSLTYVNDLEINPEKNHL